MYKTAPWTVTENVILKKAKTSSTILTNNKDKINETPRRKDKEIPRNFKIEYGRYCNKEMSLQELCRLFNVSFYKIGCWRDALGLPMKNSYKQAAVKKQNILKSKRKIIRSSKKRTLLFNIFGYKITISIVKNHKQ